MTLFLKNLIAALRRRPARRPSPPRRARLGVEAMEAREVLSTVPMLPTAALVTAPAVHADSTGGTHGGIATPETPVHGYKWRRPRPWALDAGSTGSMRAVLQSDGGAPASQSVPHRLEMVLHLAAGGADGTTFLIGGTGVVRGPQGSPAFEALAVVR
jgi:hypothetical protein